MNLTLPRHPDRGNWIDDGCEESPKCVDCPLPVCKYEIPVQVRQAAGASAAAAKARELRAAGRSLRQIAAEIGVSPRQVTRYLSGECGVAGAHSPLSQGPVTVALSEAPPLVCPRCELVIRVQRSHCPNCGLPLAGTETVTKRPGGWDGVR